MITSYYDYAKALSFNATMNQLVGGRGIGKTYGAKKKITRDAIKATRYEEREVSVTSRGKSKSETRTIGSCDNQFIYLRRYKEELAVAKATFFVDYEQEFPEHDFQVIGWEAQASHIRYREMKHRPWVTIGYFIALSVAQKYKSVSFTNVKTIVYDEYILEKGLTNYLPNEAVVFNNFYSTVDRYKDKTRVLMLANSVAINNPYFIEYKIKPEDADVNGFIRLKGGYMLVQFIDDKQFESEVYQTGFGKFIKDTEYADYAVGNQFSDNHKGLIELKPSNAKYLLTLETSDKIISIWWESNKGKYYCQESRPKNEKLFTIVAERMSENKTLVTFSDKTLSMLRTAFRHDRMRFDDPSTRNAIVEIFKR